MPSRYTKEQKQQHVDAWRQSGLLQPDYCKQHNIKRSSFKNWSADYKSSCIPVVIPPSAPTRVVILEFTSKYQVPLSIPELINVLLALC